MTVLAAAGVLLASACSSGEGSNAAAASNDASASSKETTSEQFCSSAKALYGELEDAGASDPTNPAVQAVFADAQNLDAPDDIASDWTQVLDTIEPFVSGQVDLNDPAAMATMTERAADAAGAFERTGAYFEQECGFGSTTTSAPAP